MVERREEGIWVRSQAVWVSEPKSEEKGLCVEGGLTGMWKVSPQGRDTSVAS